MSVEIRIEPATASVGANVRGLDLSQPLDNATVRTLRAALVDHLVLFFRDQPMLSVDEHVRFAHYFGEIDLPLFRTKSSERPEVLVLDQVAPKGEGADSWHADNTYMETPPMGSILQARMLPNVGGDTCFASMYAAYEALSGPMQRFLESCTAIHDSGKAHTWRQRAADRADMEFPRSEHPVVTVHPQSGRKVLFVNRGFTTRIPQLRREEGDALLEMLFRHVEKPEFHCRFKWQPGSIAFWDNRCAQHHAMWDYHPLRRYGHRVTICGEKPIAALAS